MTSTLLISEKILGEYGKQLHAILAGAPRRLAIMEFRDDIVPTSEELKNIEAAFYSRDIWAGTIKDVLNLPSQRFWAIIDAAPNIRWIQLVSAGADHRHYQQAIARGVRLTTSAGTNAEPVALTAVAGLLLLARCFPHWLRAQNRREWCPLASSAWPTDLGGQTAVIVGTGYIGTRIARALKAMDVHTIGVRRTSLPAPYFDEILSLETIDSVLRRCDWLILACPLTRETSGLVSADRFRLLPAHAGFINVSRGGVVDEVALINALTSGRLNRGAYLDVFADEPLSRESPLWTLPNVIITPHDATASKGNYARGVDLFLSNLAQYLNEGTLANEVRR